MTRAVNSHRPHVSFDAPHSGDDRRAYQQSTAGARGPGTPRSQARATPSSRSSSMAMLLPQESVVLDPLEEALLELARSAIRNRREVGERRGNMVAVEGGKQGGRTA